MRHPRPIPPLCVVGAPLVLDDSLMSRGLTNLLQEWQRTDGEKFGIILTSRHIEHKETDVKTMEDQIKAKLETLRAGLQADGGDLELVKIDGKVVYLKLVGHCGSCPFAMMTLKQGIEAALQEIDPEITVERVVD